MGCSLSSRLLAAAALLVVLGGLAEARRPALDPHVHGQAVVKPSRLVAMARRSGDLQAGLKALGLDHLPPRQAVKKALEQMDLYQPDHGTAYDAIGDFRRAAFAGSHYVKWVRATVQSARKNAKRTYMQLSAREVEDFVNASRAHGIDLKGIDLIVSMSRRNPDVKALEGVLARHSEVKGIDILGAETMEQDPRALDEALDLLLASKRRAPILRIHAGEGYLGDYGARNVNISLAALVRRSETTDLRRVRVVLAHVARVADVEAARRDLAILAARGVRVQVNVNPLSNLVYHAVEDLRDIDALRLGVKLVPGSDNVGSLETNARIVRHLAAGRFESASRLAAQSLDIQRGLYQRAEQGRP